MRSTVAIVVLVATIAPAGLAATAAPQLRIVRDAPLTIRGKSFKPRERVTLAVSLGQTRVKRVVTTSDVGSFTVVFGKLKLDRCTGSLRVEAVGTRGDRASFALEKTLDCPNGATS